MNRLVRLSLILGALVPALTFSSGCAYLHNRCTDAADIFDIGVTFTKTPHVGVYAGFQSLVGVGYADMDGYMLGLGERQFGCLPMRYRAGGAAIEGYEQYGFGNSYDNKDATSPRQRGVGLGMLYFHTPRTVVEMLQCPKFVHLGWIGFNLNCQIGELFDFIIGWTTIDIAGDDRHEPPAPPPPPAPPVPEPAKG